MIQKIEILSDQWAQRVLDLQLLSYTIEAKLIGFNELPPLKDTIQSIQQSGETFYGYFINDMLVGPISYERENKNLHICRMIVHPDYFRRGMASSLIKFVSDVEDDAVEMTVTTATKNTPAIHLYKRHGFKEIKEIEVTKGVYITKLMYLGRGHKMEIRKLKSSDAEDYVRLRLEALRENPEAFATTYEETVSIGHEVLVQKTAKQLSSQEAFTIGAFVEDQLVGVVTFMREQKTKLRHKGSVFAMYVTPSKRGKGIGKRLLEELVERAKKLNGLEQLHLTVVANNEAAVQLYRSLGFEVYGTERNAMKFEEQYWDEWLMVRFLT